MRQAPPYPTTPFPQFPFVPHRSFPSYHPSQHLKRPFPIPKFLRVHSNLEVHLRFLPESADGNRGWGLQQPGSRAHWRPNMSWQEAMRQNAPGTEFDSASPPHF